MSSSKIAESDSGAEDDIGPAYTYVIMIMIELFNWLIAQPKLAFTFNL